jgi:glycosyltransferase involved in cell wall biosynthesis
MPRLRRHLAENPVDVCLINYGTTAARVAPLLVERRVPYVVHFHGFDAHRTTGLEDLHKRYPLMLEAAAEIVVVSSTMKEAIAAWGVPAGKIRLNPYGIPALPEDADSLVSTRETDLILCAGRLVEKKAPHLVMAAFHEVWKRRPGTRLRWIGDGELRPVCEALVRGWRMEQAVVFEGVKTRAEILSAMATATVFAQHSVTAASGDMEGTPNTILEAATMGCPIVATRHAGIADVVCDASLGCLVEEYDVEGMAAALVRTLDDPEAAQERASRLRERVRRDYREDRYLEGLRESLRLAQASGGTFSEEVMRRAAEDVRLVEGPSKSVKPSDPVLDLRAANADSKHPKPDAVPKVRAGSLGEKLKRLLGGKRR